MLILCVLLLPVLIELCFLQKPLCLHKQDETSGSLTVVDALGKPKSMCPLKHTEVKAEISGFISRVVVTQQFEIPFKEKIEAVYTFPSAAKRRRRRHDDDRRRTNRPGKILPREEAQAVYEAAKSSGQVAGLLDQERPNIFTQSVANILPGEQVKITISYVETLSYERWRVRVCVSDGCWTTLRSGEQTRNHGMLWADTDRVPDASRITPQLGAAGMRSGHDISLDVTLDAGLIVDNIESKSHPVNIQRPDPQQRSAAAQRNSTIPNKDFILRYDVAGKAIQDAVLTHRDERAASSR